MRWRALAFISLGVNILLAAIWLMSPRKPGDAMGSGLTSPSAGDGSTGRTNVVVRRQFFSWQEVESADYATYIANLRGIGCPEQTIRDIIIADVNAVYSRRRSTEVLTPEQQWWRTEPDTNVIQVAVQKLKALDEERRSLLARLLGPSWESGDQLSIPRPSRPGVVLDGPILGLLPVDVKQSLQDINQHSQDRLQTYLDAQSKAGKDPDPLDLARLRQQTRDELARLLSPPQLEEYLLRYSQHAASLRSDFGALQYFNATPDEFRAVFRATDSLNERIELLAGATDANSVQARRTLEQQRDNAIRLALGQKRFEEFRNLHDPLYREAVAMAQAAGSPESAQAIFAVNAAAANEQQSILNDPSLTTEQKNIALKSLQLDQLKANTVLSGQDLPPEPPPLPPTPARRTYTLRQGDSAAVIASIYGIPESAIRAANPNVDFSRVRPGIQITIPRSALAPANAPRLVPNTPTLPSQ